MKFFGSKSFGLFITICAVLYQSHHSYIVIYEIDGIKGPEGVFFALLFVIAWESYTLFYVSRGRKWISAGYACWQILMNNFYYWQKIGWDKSFLVSVFISFILPISIYQLAREIHEEKIEAPISIPEDIWASFRKMVSDVQSKLLITPGFEDINKLQDQIDGLKKAPSAGDDNIQMGE